MQRSIRIVILDAEPQLRVDMSPGYSFLMATATSSPMPSHVRLEPIAAA